MTLADRCIALLLVELAFAILLVNKLVELLTANACLSEIIERQATGNDTRHRVDAQLDALARGTPQLARNDNAEAANIIGSLAKNGVRIDAATPQRQ